LLALFCGVFFVLPVFFSLFTVPLFSWGLQVRLLRRMARDYLFRGHTASRTLSMWENVRRGEGLWIFPFQGQVVDE